jgi:hypothetical protein
MAGSYNHVVNHRKDGGLYEREILLDMLETRSGDVYEAIEEMYGMIWYLAYSIGGDHSTTSKSESDVAKEMVEHARQNYKDGLIYSPTKRFKES